MSNFLEDGTILPSGLLEGASSEAFSAFNKTYRNTALRIGIVLQTYLTTDSANKTKLAPEYDVVCIEQNENMGVTAQVYKNCIASSSLGSIADFFEKTLRKRKKKKYKSDAPRFDHQDGSVVLILCLDGVSHRGIVIGGFPHPDRATTLLNEDPRLEGEYNGINIKIENDGSAALTFRGATDNDGKPKDASQGSTTTSVEKDGTFQIKHDKITLRLDRSGVVTVTAAGDVNINCVNSNVKASGDATITAAGTATVEAPLVKLGAGAAEAVIKGDTFKKLVFDPHIHPTPIGPSGPPSQPMSPDSLSKKVKTE